MSFGLRIGRLLVVSFTVVVALAIVTAVHADSILKLATVSSPSTPMEPAPQPITEKRAENAELLRVAQRRLESGDPTDGAAAQTVALHQSLDAVLAQQQAVEQQIKDLEKRKIELEGQIQSSPTTDAKATCSYVELDGLKDELAAENARSSLVEDRLTAAKSAAEKAQSALSDSETKRRQAQEAFNIGKTAEKSDDLAVAMEQAIQTAKLAAETVALRKSEVAREKLALEVQGLAVKLRETSIARLGPLVVFTAADYEAQVEAIKKKEDTAANSLARAQANLHNAEVQLQQAQKELAADIGDNVVLAEKVEAARRAREKLAAEIDSLTQRQQRLAQLRVAWNRRYTNAAVDRSTPNKKVFDELKSWQKDTRAILDELAADLRMEILRMRDLRGSLTSITKKIDAAKDSPDALKSWLESQKRQVEETLRIHESNLVTIETSRRVHEKLLDEIGRDVQILNPTNFALGVWHQAEEIWNTELAEFEGNSIYVGKVIKCLFIFLGGWVIARIFAAVFATRVLKRFRLSKDATAAVKALVFYSLLVIVAIVALRTVNVPLTAFTILGGGLAIGIGFGSQALINNFIGGLIMLAERPVRLGERITFGELDGVVEEVGFRCTKLRTLTDHLVTIPNSTLINESIENIARRRTIRRLMNVTITYDTPRDKVEEAVQAIREILDQKGIREPIHPIVGFEDFPPRVYFNDYNSESLNILVVYWYAPADWWPYVEHSERVNYRIMEEFERLGVDFAFPSHTVYLVNQDKKANSSRSLQASSSHARASGAA